MSLRNCNIVFQDSPLGVFFSGQNITGTFNVIQDKPKKINDLIFYITGETRVRWSESHGTGKNRRTVTFCGHEIYFRTIPISLMAAYPREADGGVVVPEGVSSFSFSIQLPPVLPTSFEGYLGKNRYYVKFISKKSFSLDKTLKIPFTVISMSDLNANPLNCMPVRQERMKDFAFLFSNRGNLQMTINLPIGGYVPGQQIPIECIISNKSRVRVVVVTFCIERIVTYTCTSPYSKCRHERDKLIEYNGEGVNKHEDKVIRIVLTVPPIPPTSTFGSLITFQYFVKVRAMVTGMHGNLKCHIPINIGNVPVQNAPYMSTLVAGSNDSSAGASTSGEFETPPPQYSEIGLPTYEESQMSAKMTEADPDDEDGGVAYTPRYPVYQFNVEKSNAPL